MRGLKAKYESIKNSEVTKRSDYDNCKSHLLAFMRKYPDKDDWLSYITDSCDDITNHKGIAHHHATLLCSLVSHLLLCIHTDEFDSFTYKRPGNDGQPVVNHVVDDVCAFLRATADFLDRDVDDAGSIKQKLRALKPILEKRIQEERIDLYDVSDSD